MAAQLYVGTVQLYLSIPLASQVCRYYLLAIRSTIDSRDARSQTRPQTPEV